MSFLTDEEVSALSIKRMILHVVGDQRVFEPQVQQKQIEHEPFFLKRICDTAVDGVHTFEESSETKGRLEQIARQELSFESGGQELARAFAQFHVKASKDGAFFLFELGVGSADVKLYSMVKYDYRSVVELVTAAGQQSLRAIIQAFVTERGAIQKSCLVRIVSGKAEPMVSAFDRMGDAPDLTDFFCKFLGVSRTRSDTELSSDLGEMLRSALTACKDILPDKNVVAALEMSKASLRGRPIVDENAMRDAIFVSSGSPTSEAVRAVLVRATTLELRRKHLIGVNFRPSAGILEQRPRLQIKTAENVVLNYPSEEEGRSVRKQRRPDGGWIITITTQRDLIDNGILPVKARANT